MALAGVVNRVDDPPELNHQEGKTHFLLLDGGLNLNLQDDVMNLHFPASRRWVLEGTEFESEKQNGTLLPLKETPTPTT